MNKHINNVIIHDDRVIKKRNDRLLELYEYLEDRGFSNYPKVLNVDDENIESEYIKEGKIYELYEGEELVKTLALLHNKTTELKSVSKNKYRDIYDKIASNIEYLKKYYEEMISNIEEEVYMSPSHYLFARDYSIIDSSIKYASSALKRWFKMVSSKESERVCIVHNNASSHHHIKGDKNYLISFDNYLVDTPILDLYKFYKNEGYKLNYIKLLNIYEQTNKLEQNEKMLLNILISIPPKIEENQNEYINCEVIKKTYNYIYSSMNIVNQNK